MRNKFLLTVAVLCVAGILAQPGCKTAEDAQYVLNVTVAAGVAGTPVTGSYSYTEGDVVNYSYAVQTGYENLVVQLDGVTVGNTGVISMNMNHTLTVAADERFDPNGDWTGEVAVSGIGDFSMEITYSGGYASGSLSGVVESIPPTGNGNYTITNNSIEFELDFGSGLIMYFSGSIENDTRMSGNWTSSWGPVGNWFLNRD
jgi:hypothetical protein